MERTELVEEKGAERQSVSMRAKDGSSSSSMQMVAEAKMLEAEPGEKVVVEGSALAENEKQGTIKGKESMGVDEEHDSSSRVVEMQLDGGSRRASRREKKVMEKSEQTEKKVMERSVSKADDETSSSSWMQMVAEAMALEAIEEMEEWSLPEEKVVEGSALAEEQVGSSSGIFYGRQQGIHGSRREQDKQRWMRPSIYRVPDWLKSMTKAEAYRPQVVSLGPFHHGGESLQPMEEQKRRLMLNMVERSKKPRDMFVDAIREVADKLQDAYYGLDVGWRGDNTNRFVEVMVTDGGFLLELITILHNKYRPGVLEAGYARYDPIFSDRSLLSLWPRIRSDMILVENQVPLLALKTLEAVRSGTFPSDADINRKINELVTDFVCPNPEEIINQEKLGLHTLEMFHRNFCSQPLKHQDELCHSKTTMLSAGELREEGVHFKRRLLYPLEMLHKMFCGGHSQPLKHQDDESGQIEIMLSAEELREAGVHFKKSPTGRFQDIDFKNGVLSMPLVEIDDSSEIAFLNLTAFEQLHSTAGSVATDYMIFMDNIIDSERDVALMRSKMVLKNFLSSDKAAADLFNTLSKGASLSPGSKVGHVQWLVAKHCERPWPKLQASFKHTYLRNPWVFFSAVAAIILLGLTILQTVYTVVPFYTKN